MTDEKKMQIEERLLELPLAQYAWIRTEELTFLERVRYICETECPRYGTSWACPPAVGTVEECREKLRIWSRRLPIGRATRRPRDG